MALAMFALYFNSLYFGPGSCVGEARRPGPIGEAEAIQLNDMDDADGSIASEDWNPSALQQAQYFDISIDEEPPCESPRREELTPSKSFMGQKLGYY